MARPIPLSELPKFLEGVAKETEKQLIKGVTTAARELAGGIAEAVMGSMDAPSPASIRTGALARSYPEGVVFVGTSRGKVTSKTTSNLPYARIQDEGGFIRPTTRQNLSIPLSMEAARRWPRDFGRTELFAITSRSGNRLLVRKDGRNRIKPLYVLKKQVQLDGKQYLERGRKSVQEKLDGLIANGLVEAFSG